MATSAPRDIHAAVTSLLSDAPEHRKQSFGLRLDRWFNDLRDPLVALYGDRADALATRLVELAATAYQDRDPELHRLDERRLLEPDWLQSPRMFGYAAYADRFAGSLPGVRDRIPYLEELGVTYLHLMPLLQPRDGDNDGGYAVQDYRRVRADLGTTEDLAALATSLREKGISLVLDLVLNHVAREHEWAVKARSGDPHYRDYFIVHPDRTEPDEYERTLPEVFPEFAPGSFTWDDEMKGWVWTTFNAWQWDVNWANPAVLLEYAEIVLVLANLGVEVLRFDAIAFMWKRKGTTCQNEPEVHAITQVLRTLARIACPAVAFKAEAIVAPPQLVPYLGVGRHHGKVSDLAYHNSLMVQIWSMLATGEVPLAARALSVLPPTPSTSTWITYVRCHDDIGWAVDDGDAATVGLNGWLHRHFLSEWFAGFYPGSPARGLTFQVNPTTGDRRISGTAAALAGLDAALEWGDAHQADLALARIVLAHTIVAGFGGIPVVWSGDELASPNDPGWAAEPGHAGDNRWANRPRLDWERAARRHDGSTAEGRVFTALAALARRRAGLPHLHASVPSQVLEVHDRGVLALLRRHPLGPMVGLYNVTDEERGWPAHRLRELGLVDPVDAMADDRAVDVDRETVAVPAYGAIWLVDRS